MSWDIAAHEWAVRLLKHHIQSDETRQAYLFTGPSGVGRRTLALQFSKAINCQNPPEPGEFCDNCRVCRQINQMKHPDLLIGQADTVGGILKIDTVREIQKSLNLKPYDAKYKIALFLRFEEANPNAANALLKTLEEPPEKSIILLTASAENALLPTIVSRCEIIRLRPMRVEALSQLLVEKKNLSNEEARRIASLSCGRPGKAFEFADDPSSIEHIEAIATEALYLLRQNRRERFHAAERFRDVRKRGDLRESLLIWQSLFRDLMLISASGGWDEDHPQPLTFINLLPDLKPIASRAQSNVFCTCAENINKMTTYLNANSNLQLLAENIFLDWPEF